MKEKDVIKFLKSKETYKQVKRVLSERGRLSAANSDCEFSLDYVEGFIAGGSVSNILYSLLHGGEPVVNDIDIFQYNKQKENGDPYPEWVSPVDPEFPHAIDTELFSSSDGYGNRFIRPNGDFSIMLSHTRQGILNYIKVHVGSRKSEFDKNIILLNSFDINSCQSGIDLENEKLVYTESFIEFLRSRQMLATVAINPIQTVMRIHRKLSDLDCYCDFEEEVKILKHACLLEGVSKTFGEETYEKYLKHKDIIDEHFTITKYDKGRTSTFGYNTWMNSDSSYDGELWNFEPKLDSYDLPFQFKHPIELMNYCRTIGKGVGNKKKRKYKRLMDTIYKDGVGDSKTQGTRNSKHQVFESTLTIPYHYKEQRLELGTKLGETKVHNVYHPCWVLMITNKGYCECDFDEKHIDYINDFVREHRGLGKLIHAFDGLTVQSHYNMMRSIKSIANKRGGWIVGELENLKEVELGLLSDSDDPIKWIDDFMDTKQEEMTKPLVEPIDLTGFEYKDNVKELISIGDLRSEGHRMGHCVGGYGSRVGDNSCRIFTIEFDGVSSTLEVRMYNENSRYYLPQTSYKYRGIYSQEFLKHATQEDEKRLQKIVTALQGGWFKKGQHYGKYPLVKGNATPTDENRDIANALIDYLSNNHGQTYFGDLLVEKHQIEERIYKNMEEAKEVERQVRVGVDDIW